MDYVFDWTIKRIRESRASSFTSSVALPPVARASRKPHGRWGGRTPTPILSCPRHACSYSPASGGQGGPQLRGRLWCPRGGPRCRRPGRSPWCRTAGECAMLRSENCFIPSPTPSVWNFCPRKYLLVWSESESECVRERESWQKKKFFKAWKEFSNPRHGIVSPSHIVVT